MGYSQSIQINSAVRGFKSWQDEWMAECFELFNGAVDFVSLFCADRTVYAATFKKASTKMLNIGTDVNQNSGVNTWKRNNTQLIS